MRLAIVSTFPPFRGGIAQFNEAMATALEGQGHEVVRITWSRQYPDALFPGKSQWEPGKGAADMACPALLDSMNPGTWRRVGRSLKQDHDVEVVVLPFWHAALAPALRGVARAAMRDGVRVWSVMHNAVSHDAKPWDRWLTRAFVRAVDHHFTLSQPVFDALGLPNATNLFHPLYDNNVKKPRKAEAQRRLGIPEGKVVHLFFGLIRPYKGLDVLLQALAQTDDAHMVVVAGECYGSWEPYQSAIDALGLGDRVMVHNEFIEDQLVPVYLGAADHVVLPYKAASQSGVTALVLHHDLPVIASDVGDLASTVVPELTGRLVPAGDATRLAEAMTRPWTAQPNDVQAAFKEVKKRLSWPQFAAQMTTQEPSEEA